MIRINLVGRAIQSGDAFLDSIAGLEDNGLLVRIGAEEAAARTIVGTANQVNVANGDGVAGNPTLSLPQSIETTSNVTFGSVLTTGANGIRVGMSVGDVRFQVFDTGDSFWVAPPATSGTPNVNSPGFFYTSSRWDGSAAQAEGFGQFVIRYGAGSGQYLYWLRTHPGNLVLLAMAGDTSGAASFGYEFPDASLGQLHVRSRAVTTITLVKRAAASQSADIDRCEDSSGNPLHRHDKLGRPATANTTPTIAAGAGAGTAPTVSVTGTDVSGVIAVTTGTSPSASAVVATVSFSVAYGSTPKGVLLTPCGINSAALSGAGTVYEDQATRAAGSFALKVGSAALAESTTYLFNYRVDG
jgi:hypothetical protein